MYWNINGIIVEIHNCGWLLLKFLIMVDYCWNSWLWLTNNQNHWNPQTNVVNQMSCTQSQQPTMAGAIDNQKSAWGIPHAINLKLGDDENGICFATLSAFIGRIWWLHFCWNWSFFLGISWDLKFNQNQRMVGEYFAGLVYWILRRC